MLCAAAMLAAVWAARLTMPAWPPVARVAVLAPLGTVVYLTGLFLFDRRQLAELLDFAKSAVARRRAPSTASNG
jgi:hypothetical protein